MYLPFKRINTGTVYGLLIRGRPAWFSNVPPGMEIGLSGYGAVQQITKKQFQGYFQDFERIFSTVITIVCTTIVSHSGRSARFPRQSNTYVSDDKLDYDWIYAHELIVIEYRGNLKKVCVSYAVPLCLFSGQATNFSTRREQLFQSHPISFFFPPDYSSDLHENETFIDGRN